MFTNVNTSPPPSKPNSSLPLLIKVREVAKLLSVSPQTIHNLILSGDLHASEVNPVRNKRKSRRHMRITQYSLLKFYKKRFGHSLIDALAHPFEP